MGRQRERQVCASQGRSSRERFGRRHRHGRSTEEVFKCRNCRRFIGALPSGGHHRNHCPFCLYSRHVDEKTGDRLSECGSRMEPVGRFERPNGEEVLVHRCLGCGFERFNRVAADDNVDAVEALPIVPARSSQEMKRLRLEAMLGELEVEEGSL